MSALSRKTASGKLISRRIKVERLNKYIARCGIASRRKADELIAAGRVSVNGVPAPPSGLMIDPDKDSVTVDGSGLEASEHPVYYKLNKPAGYYSTVSDPHVDDDMTVCSLVPAEPRVFPVGRLDAGSCGLIILTNDGELANMLTHPSFEHEKEYEVFASWEKHFPGKTKGRKIVISMERGLNLEGKMTLPAKVEIRRIDESGVLFRIILKEGRNRQIRKMCELLGLKVLTLQRIRIGGLLLGELLPGDYEIISKEDIL